MILLWNTLIPDMKVPNHDLLLLGGGNLNIIYFQPENGGR